jgi:hypothetical protein
MTLFALVLLITSSASALADGYLEELKMKGFVCSSVEGGTSCVLRPKTQPGYSYSEPVAVLVPSALTQAPKRGIFYFHGFLRVCAGEQGNTEKLAGSLPAKFRFLELLTSAGAADSVVVMPMSEMNTSPRGYITYNRDLRPNFPKFLGWLKSFVPAEKWIVTGHSGAGALISDLLSVNTDFTKNVTGVALLDATYGNRSGQWQTILRVNPALRVQSIYIPNSPTADGSLSLKAVARELGAQVSLSTAPAGTHCEIPKPEYFAPMLRELIR